MPDQTVSTPRLLYWTSDLASFDRSSKQPRWPVHFQLTHEYHLAGLGFLAFPGFSCCLDEMTLCPIG
jgi:hypothetical protein